MPNYITFSSHKEPNRRNPDMSIKNAPDGALFPYYYKNGELFGLHLGSFGADEDGLIARLKADEAFFLEQNHSIGMWLDLCQTKMTDRVIGELIQFLEHTRHLTLKMALVGCSTIDRWRINRAIKKAKLLSDLPIRYYDDPEVAKTWLVTEPR
jgi:hypothetical protein